MTAEQAWQRVVDLRRDLERFLCPATQERLNDLLDAWRVAHLTDVVEQGPTKIAAVARKMVTV